MTQDEIEHMWKVASNNPNHDTNWHDPVVETFAKLVAEKERKDCSELCMDLHTLTDGAHNFYQFAANQILKMGQA
jgi:hypothetical protein